MTIDIAHKNRQERITDNKPRVRVTQQRSTCTAHEPYRETRALDEARAERVVAAGRLVRAGRREDPAERRGRGLPRADAAGGLLHG